MYRPTHARPVPGPIADPLAAQALDPDFEPIDPASLGLADAETCAEPIRVPGLAAMFRRHPRVLRGGALGCIAAGVVVFVAAGSAMSVASADAKHHVAATRPSFTPRPVTQIPPPLGPLGAAAGNGADNTVPRKAPKPAPSDPRAISGLAANGIPSVALNAYRVAAARMNNVDPGCHIDWSLIAGIGRVESDHGRFGGAVLHADGISTPRIIGPALDGKHWDYIPAPANGLALDGDARYAHALGPMQFIPSTWAIYGADETGDGKADIFNINDAALGTARYLCSAGGDLSTLAGKQRAVLTYNHSSQYLAEVLALADAYHRGLRVTGIPLVGVTKGGLPAVTDTGYVPPANPGAPTAVDGSSKHKGKTGKGGKTGTSGGTKSTNPAPTGTHTTAPAGSGSSTSKPPAGSSTPPPPTTSSTPPPGSGTSSCSLLNKLLHKC